MRTTYTNIHFSPTFRTAKKKPHQVICNNLKCGKRLTDHEPVVKLDKHNSNFSHPATYFYHPDCVPSAAQSAYKEEPWYHQWITNNKDLKTLLLSSEFREVENEFCPSHCLICLTDLNIGDPICWWKDLGSSHKTCFDNLSPRVITQPDPIVVPVPVKVITQPVPEPVPSDPFDCFDTFMDIDTSDPWLTKQGYPIPEQYRKEHID